MSSFGDENLPIHIPTPYNHHTKKREILFWKKNLFAQNLSEAFGTGSGVAGWFAGISGGR